MAVLTLDLYSDALDMGTSVTVVLPQRTESQIGVRPAAATGELPVLYLLHGLSDDHTAWTRYTSVERYAAEAGLAVVMPAAGRSFYADEAHGLAYWTWISEELPATVSELFRVSDRREDTFVAGLSMGGYGAMKLALTQPTRFAAAATLSGGLDVVAISQFPHRRDLLDRVFGGPPGPGEDLFGLLAGVDQALLPPLYVACGNEDPLLPFSERFASQARSAGAAVTTDFRSGGHEWQLWDDTIRDVIAWLPIATVGT